MPRRSQGSYVTLGSGLLIPEAVYEDLSKSPLSKPELERIREYTHALEDILRKTWEEEPKLALQLVTESCKFANELVDKYDFDKGIPRAGEELLQLAHVTSVALAKAHDWYHHSGRRMPEQDWLRLGKPNLAVVGGKAIDPSMGG